MKWSYEYVQNDNYNLYHHPTLHYAVVQAQSFLRFSDPAEELAVKQESPACHNVQEPVVLRMDTWNGDTDWVVQYRVFVWLR